MLSLRTCEGLDLTQLTDSERQYCLSQARSYLADGQLRRQDDRLILTRCGLFVSDMVMSSLMQV
jgi:oxygen-independent coproporphyrinogen-3 oxidase